jgi:hypothetical protein
MRREINPSSFPEAQSNYSRGVVHDTKPERLAFPGRVGIRANSSARNRLLALTRTSNGTSLILRFLLTQSAAARFGRLLFLA